jgi:RNA polymerase sigma-70 factor (ECF subfamily)
MEQNLIQPFLSPRSAQRRSTNYRGDRMSRLPVASPGPADTEGPGISAEALIALRTDMFRFAQLQLRNRETAEDMVQEAIESALRNASSFAGHSSLKTWVFAILKNRIIDHLRQAGRTVPISSLVEDGEDWQERLESLFNERGGWRDSARPTAWPNPEESMQNKQFWVVFEACLDHLPANTGRVFMMREFLGLESDEICAQLSISTSNCHVILHRARLKLRACLGNGWARMGDATC